MPKSFAIKSVLLALESATIVRFTTVKITAETYAYVDHLEKLHGNENSFEQFMAGLPFRTLEKEIQSQVFPARLKPLFDEHLLLDEKKQSYIQSGDFNGAAKCRDRQFEIVESINSILPGSKLEITPDKLKTSLRNLGCEIDLEA